jgi:predicted neutral ceramidase superfamily lipid hydrolase
MLILAVILIVLVGLAHSVLGERYILTRLFRQPLPEIFGSDEFTKMTLRFAWHITTVAWLGFAAILLLVQADQLSRVYTLLAISTVFSISATIALVASRGRHLSWLVFSAISIACYLST